VYDENGNDLGSYEGHQERYRRVQEKLNEAFDRADDNNCDHFDANAIGGDEAEQLYQRIETEKNRPVPQRPDQGGQQGFVLPSWAIEQGVRFIDGVLIIPIAVSAFVLFLLMKLVEIFSLVWRFSS
jgi:hypothetical protein